MFHKCEKSHPHQLWARCNQNNNRIYIMELYIVPRAPIFSPKAYLNPWIIKFMSCKDIVVSHHHLCSFSPHKLLTELIWSEFNLTGSSYISSSFPTPLSYTSENITSFTRLSNKYTGDMGGNKYAGYTGGSRGEYNSLVTMSISSQLWLFR